MAETISGVWLALQSGWGVMHSEITRFHEGVYQRLYSPESAMDSLSTLLFGWIIFSLMCFFVGSYLHGRYLKPKPKEEDEKKKDEKAKKKEDERVTGEPAKAQVVAERPQVAPAVVEEKCVVKEVQESAVDKVPTIEVLAPIVTKPTDAGIEALTPKAMGPDPDSVQWVNSVLRWLYVNPNFAKDIYHSWLAAINDFAARIAHEYEVEAEVYPEEEPSTSVPALSNIFTDFASTDNITVTCDFSINMELSVMAKRLDEEESPRICLSVMVEQLRGRLNIAFLTEDLLAVAKFDGWPEIKLSIEEAEDEDEQYVQECVSDILTAAFRNTVMDLSISKYPTFPRFVRSKAVTEPLMGSHVQYDNMLQGSLRLDPNTDKRLLVKVVKASNLGQSKGCVKPSCVIEMDEPPQKHSTTIKTDTTNPFWDETFLFDLSQGTAEVLFEIYDRSKMDENFLGLGIVGIEELLVTPSQRQIIPLQSRPYENDPVSGSLTVEFLFMEGVELPMNDGPLVTTETTLSMTPSGQLITNTKTTIARTDEVEELLSEPRSLRRTNSYDLATKLGDFLEQLDKESVTDAALNAIGSTSVPGSNPSKSTLVIQGVQKDGESIGDADSLMSKPHDDRPVPPDFEYDDEGERHTMVIHSKPKMDAERAIVKVAQDERGAWHEVSEQEYERNQTNHSEAPTSAPSVCSSIEKEDERGRSRKKKRTFFGSIRRRIREMRSKSMEPGRSSSREGSDTAARSVSQDRARALAVDNQQTFLLVPGARSRHSSMSEMSNISGASSRTFIDESSTLVLETVENGINKYYLIPIHLAHSSNLRKKGTKLHVYNDHIFVAKHLPSGILCSVCKVPIPRRPGKQGYQCRDCHLISHKECHIRTEQACPNSTVQVLELQIKKGYPSLPSSHSLPRSTHPRRSRARRSNSVRCAPNNATFNGFIPSTNDSTEPKKPSIFKRPSLLRKGSWRWKISGDRDSKGGKDESPKEDNPKKSRKDKGKNRKDKEDKESINQNSQVTSKDSSKTSKKDTSKKSRKSDGKDPLKNKDEKIDSKVLPKTIAEETESSKENTPRKEISSVNEDSSETIVNRSESSKEHSPKTLLRQSIPSKMVPDAHIVKGNSLKREIIETVALNKSPKKTKEESKPKNKDKSHKKKSSGIFKRAFFKSSSSSSHSSSPLHSRQSLTNADAEIDPAKPSAQPVMTKNETAPASPAKIVNIDREESKKKRRLKGLFRRSSFKFGKPNSPKLTVNLPLEEKVTSAQNKLNTNVTPPV